MDINIILWFGGMIFSLGIFAVKVGVGIAFGRLNRRQIGFILLGYLLLFAILTVASSRLLEIIAPMLKSGAYIHIAMSAGLALWGLALLISGCKAKKECKIQDSKFKIQNLTSEIQNSKNLITNGGLQPRISKFKIPQSILLIIPCPVCITAIGISVSSALAVLKTSPIIVGLSMGLFFIVFTAGLAFILKPREEESTDIYLGLSMLGIALYFIGSLFIPQKIEEARLAYQSFSASSTTLITTQATGVLVLALAIFAIGFLFYKDIEDIL